MKHRIERTITIAILAGLFGGLEARLQALPITMHCRRKGSGFFIIPEFIGFACGQSRKKQDVAPL
jgi:hypothetical protein